MPRSSLRAAIGPAKAVTAKPTRATAAAGGAIKIEYGYPERTSDARIRIRVRPRPDTQGKGYCLQIDSDMGWTSGQLSLDGTTSVNDVPVARRGENQFRVMIFDRSGNPVRGAETRLVVKRTEASSSGTPISPLSR